jgi:hypothetical protein
MALTKEQIRTAAMELDPVEREALAEELMLSVGEGDREAIEAAWLTEAQRRSAAFDRGETGERDVDEVIARIRNGKRA